MKHPYYFKYGVCPQGFNAEERFFNLCNKNNIQITKTTLKENKKHKDFIIENTYSIDVKSMKKICRKDECVQDKFIWIELENFNKSGWLYGKQDLLGFEYTEGFNIVWRDKLVELVEKNLVDEYVKKPEDALYKKYVRYGDITKSILTMIKLNDITEEIIYKKLV